MLIDYLGMAGEAESLHLRLAEPTFLTNSNQGVWLQRVQIRQGILIHMPIRRTNFVLLYDTQFMNVAVPLLCADRLIGGDFKSTSDQT
jgi:hypothetical protein